MTGKSFARSSTSLAEVEDLLAARTPESRIGTSLRRIGALCAGLGNPQHCVPVVHLTGTNGKTSTARMVDEILRSHGLRVGRYTSPHLQMISERIVIDGEPLPGATLVELFDRIRPLLDQIDATVDVPVSFFEAVTALGFLAFAEMQLDATVVEVGLGGAWDATNIADGTIAVVTRISLDHTELLGPDEVTIAREKAGIIKPGSTVVLAEQRPDVTRVLRRRAEAVGAGVIEIGEYVQVIARRPRPDGQLLRLQGVEGEYPEVLLPLHGAHQVENAVTAVVAAELLLARTGHSVDTAATATALARVTSPGRLQVVETQPPLLVDAAHNPAGIVTALGGAREVFPDRPVVVVLAVLADKDVDGVLQALGSTSAVVATRNGSPRALPAFELGERAASALGRGRVMVEPDLTAAIELGRQWATAENAVVLITGSVVTVAEALALLAP